MSSMYYNRSDIIDRFNIQQAIVIIFKLEATDEMYLLFHLMITLKKIYMSSIALMKAKWNIKLFVRTKIDSLLFSHCTLFIDPSHLD